MSFAKAMHFKPYFAYGCTLNFAVTFYILVWLEKKSVQKIATKIIASMNCVKIGALKVILYLGV
jgi:hypothetical protein